MGRNQCRWRSGRFTRGQIELLLNLRAVGDPAQVREIVEREVHNLDGGLTHFASTALAPQRLCQSGVFSRQFDSPQPNLSVEDRNGWFWDQTPLRPGGPPAKRRPSPEGLGWESPSCEERQRRGTPKIWAFSP